ncbi:hypothetical protein HK100_007301 [Physocladia obscura]|uniref:Uncharacterized protein n=1 Tax=Physocladia obscura TaxID=109957 RepID=A0AAD5T4T2_9FUNG|nr:hypothetical protein HK100_007301 [Physocladia obscura]
MNGSDVATIVSEFVCRYERLEQQIDEFRPVVHKMISIVKCGGILANVTFTFPAGQTGSIVTESNTGSLSPNFSKHNGSHVNRGNMRSHQQSIADITSVTAAASRVISRRGSAYASNAAFDAMMQNSSQLRSERASTAIPIMRPLSIALDAKTIRSLALESAESGGSGNIGENDSSRGEGSGAGTEEWIKDDIMVHSLDFDACEEQIISFAEQKQQQQQQQQQQQHTAKSSRRQSRAHFANLDWFGSDAGTSGGGDGDGGTVGTGANARDALFDAYEEKSRRGSLWHTAAHFASMSEMGSNASISQIDSVLSIGANSTRKQQFQHRASLQPTLGAEDSVSPSATSSFVSISTPSSAVITTAVSNIAGKSSPSSQQSSFSSPSPYKRKQSVGSSVIRAFRERVSVAISEVDSTIEQSDTIQINERKVNDMQTLANTMANSLSATSSLGSKNNFFNYSLASDSFQIAPQTPKSNLSAEVINRADGFAVVNTSGGSLAAGNDIDDVTKNVNNDEISPLNPRVIKQPKQMIKSLRFSVATPAYNENGSILSLNGKKEVANLHISRISLKNDNSKTAEEIIDIAEREFRFSLWDNGLSSMSNFSVNLEFIFSPCFPKNH